MTEESIDISEIIGGLTKRWKMIVSFTIIAGIIAAGVSFLLIKPKYQAKTKLFIGKQVEAADQNYNSSEIQMYQQLMKTYSDVIKTKDLVERGLARRGMTYNSEEVLKNLEVSSQAQTQLLEIKYTSTEPQKSKEVLEVVSEEFIATAVSLISNANVREVEQVRLPERPISPNKTLNIAIGTILGLMIGIGLALLLEFMDNTLKSKEQLEKLLGAPVIGAIPQALGEHGERRTRKSS